MEGASNWMSTAYHPGTGLFYLSALEKCNVYTKTPMAWKAGEGYLAAAPSRCPDESPQKILRAIDIETDEIAWEFPQTGPANSWEESWPPPAACLLRRGQRSADGRRRIDR